MSIYGAILPGAASFMEGARLPAELSAEATRRWEVVQWYQEHGDKVRLTARHFGFSPDTVSRWVRAYAGQGLAGLEPRSRRPNRVRQPTTPTVVVLRIQALREQYPRWGKDKLVVLLRQRGWDLSTSMVGRIRTHLKARRVLREPLRAGISTRKRVWRRPYAVRKPKGYAVKEPGDLVQLDTLVYCLSGAFTHT